MDLALLRQLTTGEGWGLLQSLPPYDETSALPLQQRLRAAGFDPDLVAAALNQSRLRARAMDKFGEFARGMVLTSDGLEQATRLGVAAQHAQRFRAAGIHTVHDLGCGIGADAMAMAGLDLRVRAIDVDEVTAAMAAVNLRHWPDSTARHGAVESFRPPAGEGARGVGAWLDPARRTPGVADAAGRTRRVFALAEISPSWETVQSIAAALPATGAKLSPGFPHAAVPAGVEAQWTSWDGDVVECALWWGPLVRTAGRTAAVLRSGAPSVVVTEAEGDDTPSLVNLAQVGAWLYEPDRAVLRAGLVSALTAATGGSELDSGVGYVTADQSVEVPYARRYAVVEAMPFNVKALRGWLRDHGFDRLTIKKRGVSVDADLLRRQLRLPPRGTSEAVVVLTRVRSNQVALIVRPA
ncbi:class I SAM-dependent methyltransferase [Nostocoides sp. HKS02]|uniref:class I SAM-dependent methyltransferase n=1 Tax=Nostocoides sp. HKS02 TaxID=1813880 RepID=UPI0012B46410|nr:class I SAM-dependent methyltransferase [Tetrasphaera sp. HKS02]QGN59240.1 class I SAM-dependent methyltransferase [Tetrasphaera sp. HKS02]